MAAKDATILAQNLTYEYTRGRGVIDVSFEIGGDRGHTIALVGENGSGKSTLLALLATTRRPQSGTISLHASGRAADPWADQASLARCRAALGVAFQTPSLDGSLTAAENLRLTAAAHGIRPRDARDRADDLLTRLDAADLAGRRTAKLSGGQRRRVDLARAMLPGPLLLLLDEPTAGLDAAAADTLAGVIRERTTGVTILATHDAQLAAACDRVIILRQGRVALDASPAEAVAGLGASVVYLESAGDNAHGRSAFDAVCDRGWILPAAGSGATQMLVCSITADDEHNQHDRERAILTAARTAAVAVRIGPPTLADAIEVFGRGDVLTNTGGTPA